MDKITSLAPGRICLFGDHQDYLGLPIIACAINKHIRLEATPNDSSTLHIHALDIQKEIVIRINDPLDKVEKGDFYRAALVVLSKIGCIPHQGYDITIKGNIAINAGISSSSALVISWISFLLEAYGCNSPVTSELIAYLAYDTEVLQQDSSGGKMDQYSIALGNVIYLETGEDLYYKSYDLDIEGLIIGESGIPKDTLGLLKNLKTKAWASIDKVQEYHSDFEIKDATITQLSTYLNFLPARLKPYFLAAVTNHDITKRAIKELTKEKIDLPKIGQLMNEHHKILRDVLNITVPKIDDMIDAALEAGAYGAKIVGSGKGGCITVLSHIDSKQQVIEAITKAGAKDAYEVRIDPGARILENDYYNCY